MEKIPAHIVSFCWLTATLLLITSCNIFLPFQQIPAAIDANVPTQSDIGLINDIYFSAADFPIAVDKGYSEQSLDCTTTDIAKSDAAPPCISANCRFGCTSDMTRCNRLAPANYEVKPFYDLITGGLNINVAETVIVNTNDGSISGQVIYRPAGSAGQVINGIYYNQVTQSKSNGQKLAVFGLSNLNLAINSKMSISGQLPVAFYVLGDANIKGIINGRALNRLPGPGGSAGGEKNSLDGATCVIGGQGAGGNQIGSGDYELETGGGGGGNGGQGGNGGDVSYNTPNGYLFSINGAAGGKAAGATLTAGISGGCGGGAGGGPDAMGGINSIGGYGGGGGGGMQLSANGQILIEAGGGIDMAGAGGQGGNNGCGGGGGGSGGSILLEAATIFNNGLIAANGGGGGAGSGLTTFGWGATGFNGQFAVSLAAGGNANTACTGQVYYSYCGGAGANGGGCSQVDGANAFKSANSGGGGGAAGRIHFRYFSQLAAGNTSPSVINTDTTISLW